MKRTLFAMISLVTAIAIWVTKTGLFGFEWYMEATALFAVGAILLWSVWLDWREEALWGKNAKKKKSAGPGSFEPGGPDGHIDVFPDD